MKRNFSSVKLIAFIGILSLLASGCLKDKVTHTYTLMYPVYASKASVVAGIKMNVSEPVKAPGKIFLYGNYIFLNEVDKGVHVIDNSNPAKPLNIGFIKIPGNLDIAVKGNTLYADMYTDLLAIDITNPREATFKNSVPKVFPDRQYGFGFSPDTTQMIVDWIKKDTTVTLSNRSPYFPCIACNFLTMDAQSYSSGAAKSAPGVAGSMARIVIVNDYLYAVNNSDLKTISIAQANEPSFVKSNPIGWGIETIFPFKDKLFIGSNTGMFIYSIANPQSPLQMGTFSHVRACDPVVADDNYAFVTLRDGTACQGTVNRLDILDVTNVMSPSLLKSVNMTNPHGVAKDGNTLFVCDGRAGLKVYDASGIPGIILIKQIEGIDAYDAIAWNKHLLLVTKEGLRQYDYSNLNDIRLLSTITVSK